MEKTYLFFKKNILWLLIFGCFIGFLAFAENVFNKEIMTADVIGYKILSEHFISDELTPLVKFITSFGGVYVIAAMTVILIFTVKNKISKILIPVNLCIAVFLNQSLKFLLQRPRPDEFQIIDETGYSFPSGHSMISLAFYGYLIYLIYLYFENRYLKWILIILLSLLILSVGISRIYLGVHYTSDVIAGFLIAAAYLMTFVKCTEKLRGGNE